MRCRARKCKAEVYDEGPYCLAHLGDVYMGRMLRGDFGERERLEAIAAIAAGPTNHRAEIARLLSMAD